MNYFMDFLDSSFTQHLLIQERNILIVEDDPTWQEIFGRVVRSVDRSAVILKSESMESAKPYLEQRPIDLVIADYFLSGIGTGVDLWRHCVRLNKNTKFLLASGLNQKALVNTFLLEEELPLVIQKPFSPKDCKNLVKKLICLKNDYRP